MHESDRGWFRHADMQYLDGQSQSLSVRQWRQMRGMNRWWAKLLLGGGASAPLYILLLGISNGRKRRTWGSGGAARSSPYSRPLDVHRWSDHPEVTGLVDNLWPAHFSDMGRPARNPGPKPKTSFQQLRIPRKMGIDSTRSWALVPRHRGQPFHAKVGGWFDRLFHGVRLALTGQGLCCERRLFACFLR